MTASLVNAEKHTDLIGTIAQNFLKPIVIPSAAPEAPADQGVAVSDGVAEPSFHLSPRLVLAVVLATVLLSAFAIMIVATVAPQGFAAGS